MSDADKYWASARDCLCKAEKALYPEDKQAWMDMAETWLEPISKSSEGTMRQASWTKPRKL